jgi:Coenzyme PQQ synthesis protein D (PqqD)
LELRILEKSTIVVSNQLVSGDLLDGEVAILNLPDGVYYGLNDVGRRVWDLIQQPRTVHELKEILLQEYDVDPEKCSRELIDLLQDLAKHGLIIVNNDTDSEIL